MSHGSYWRVLFSSYRLQKDNLIRLLEYECFGSDEPEFKDSDDEEEENDEYDNPLLDYEEPCIYTKLCNNKKKSTKIDKTKLHINKKNSKAMKSCHFHSMISLLHMF